MSEIIFSNEQGNGIETSPLKDKLPTSSGAYSEIKPFYASRYGNSRLFTAKNNGKKVIIKALKAACAQDAKCRAALRQEYETTSMLENKFIRKAVEFTPLEGLGDCIVFDYVEGKTLAEHVRVGTLSEKQVKNILVDLCDALTYIHRNQVIHANLNPENILITANDYRVRLIDFGAPETPQEADRELLIKEMEFVAPEIIKGEDIDSRSDIYSLGKIMEFIGERNISKQYSSTATHCTQFSKEQRYDSISEVKSSITKGHPLVKLLIAILLLGLICLIAFMYVPKIKDNMAKEKAERVAVEFARELENIQNESPALCEKYKLQSIDEPIAFNWVDDSLRLAQNLMPFFGMNDYKAKALQALDLQKNRIEERRKADFNTLLLNEFKTSQDSLAVVLKSNLEEPTDSVLFIEASKWFEQRK